MVDDDECVVLCTEHTLKFCKSNVTISFKDILGSDYDMVYDCYISTIDDRCFKFHCLHVLYLRAGVLRLHIRHLRGAAFADQKHISINLGHASPQHPLQCLFIPQSRYICTVGECYIEVADISTASSFARKRRVSVESSARLVSAIMADAFSADRGGAVCVCVEKAGKREWLVVSLSEEQEQGQEQRQIDPTCLFRLTDAQIPAWSDVACVAHSSTASCMYLAMATGRVLRYESGRQTCCCDLEPLMATSTEYVGVSTAGSGATDSAVNQIASLHLVTTCGVGGGAELVLALTTFGQLFILATRTESVLGLGTESVLGLGTESVLTLEVIQEYVGVGGYACTIGSCDGAAGSGLCASLLSVDDCWGVQLVRAVVAHPAAPVYVLPLSALGVLSAREAQNKMRVKGSESSSPTLNEAKGDLCSVHVITVCLADALEEWERGIGGFAAGCVAANEAESQMQLTAQLTPANLGDGGDTRAEANNLKRAGGVSDGASGAKRKKAFAATADPSAVAATATQKIVDLLDQKLCSARLAVEELKSSVRTKDAAIQQYYSMISTAVCQDANRAPVIGVETTGGLASALVPLFTEDFLSRQARNRLQRQSVAVIAGGRGARGGLGRLAMRNQAPAAASMNSTGGGISVPKPVMETTGSKSPVGDREHNGISRTEQGCIITRGVEVFETAYIPHSFPECGVTVLVYLANRSHHAVTDLHLSCSVRGCNSGSDRVLSQCESSRCCLLGPHCSAILCSFVPLSKDLALDLALQHHSRGTGSGSGAMALTHFDVSLQFQRPKCDAANTSAKVTRHLFVGTVSLDAADVAAILAPGAAVPRGKAAGSWRYSADRLGLGCIPLGAFGGHSDRLVEHWMSAHRHEYLPSSAALEHEPTNTCPTQLSKHVQYCPVSVCVPLALDLRFRSQDVQTASVTTAVGSAVGDTGTAAVRRSVRQLENAVAALGTHLQLTTLEDGPGVSAAVEAGVCGGQTAGAAANIVVVLPLPYSGVGDAAHQCLHAPIRGYLRGHSRVEVITALLLLNQVAPRELTVRPDNSILLKTLMCKLARCLLRELTLTGEAYRVQHQHILALGHLRGSLGVPSLRDQGMIFGEGLATTFPVSSGGRSNNFGNILNHSSHSTPPLKTMDHARTIRTLQEVSTVSQEKEKEKGKGMSGKSPNRGQSLGVNKNLKLPSANRDLFLGLIRAQGETDMAFAMMLLYS